MPLHGEHSKASSRENDDTTLHITIYKEQHRLTVLKPTLRMLLRRRRHNTNLQLQLRISAPVVKLFVAFEWD